MPKGRFFVLFFFFIFSYSCVAQNSGEVPLSKILNDISALHGIKFNRIDQDIEIYYLVPPSKKLTADKKIEYLQNNTKLQFTAINSKLYSIHNTLGPENPLCGYLIDAATGNVIAGAGLSVDNSIQTVSDANGYFSLLLDQPYPIKISHIAYRTTQLPALKLYVSGCPKIYLETAVTELQEVITERYIARGISKRDNGELSIKPKDFGVLPGLTEADVMQTMLQVPGIISVDETVSNINVRSGTQDQNLFLWNGIRMFQTSHFFGLISAFNPLQATSISIYKNGTPAFFGESVSSLINISTASKQPRFNTIAMADMISTNAGSTVRLGKKDELQLTVRRSLPWETPTFNKYSQRIYQNTVITDIDDAEKKGVATQEDFYFYDFSFSYLHKINNKHNFFVNGIGIQNNLKVNQEMLQASRKSLLNQKSFGGSLNIVSQWNDKSKTEIKTYISHYKLNAENQALENDQMTWQGNSILDKGLLIKYDYTLSDRTTVNTGYQLNEISITNYDAVNMADYSKREKAVSVTHAAIATGAYHSGNYKTKLNIGVRGNYFKKYKTLLVEPRLTFSQYIAQGLRLEVLGEKKSQTVSQIIDRQQDFLGIEKRRWVLADNDSIPVEKSNQVSIGINYSKNKWVVTFNCFYKDVKGISSDSQGFRNQFEFTSTTGQYSTQGFEILLQKKIADFYTWLSYNYSNSDYLFKGYTPPGFTNNFRILHALTTAVVYEHNNFQAALGGKWHTGTPFTQAASAYIDADNPANSLVLYKNPNSSVLQNSFQLNFSASKTWKLSHSTEIVTACSILNVLNRKNVISRYYRINKTSNSLESINTYGLRRTPNISIKLIF